MSMIKCIECGNMISDKSKVCIHCGCPTSESINQNATNGLDESIIKNYLINDDGIHATTYVSETLNISIGDALAYIKEYKQKNAEVLNAMKQNMNQNKNIPKCPTCGSTKIEKISASAKLGGAMMFGVLSKTAKSQFKCKSCGYKW